jgi:mRNA-degrading endonuclease RelE of RelBE toxin-antitoxin system
MSLTILPTPEFNKSVKKLFKRYKRIAEDLTQLEHDLQDNPHVGINIGHNCFKLRLANSSVPTGKSGGFRVIYFLRKEEKIYLLAIYSKSDLENLDDSRLLEILVSNGL